MTSFWDGFANDPRSGANAVLRASDSDRDRVTSLLAEAYADGRLTREEYDTRSGQALTAATLGDLPPIVAGLIPATVVGRTPDPVGDVQQAARSQTLNGVAGSLPIFVVPSLICLVVWMVSGRGYFWPGWVMLGTAIPLLLAVVTYPRAKRHAERTIARRQTRELE